MPKKKITAHIRAAALRAARELCFTVIQNTKILSWQKTRNLRDTRPWRKKKEEKNDTVPVKLPLTHSAGRSNTEYSCPHQISVSDLSTRVVSLSTRWQETQKFRFSHLWQREMPSLFCSWYLFYDRTQNCIKLLISKSNGLRNSELSAQAVSPAHSKNYFSVTKYLETFHWTTHASPVPFMKLHVKVHRITC